MKTHHLLSILIALPLFCSCRSSQSMLGEIQALKSNLYYEFTSSIYQEKTDQAVYLNLIGYSNVDYYTSVKRKKSVYIPLLLYNYEGRLFHLRLGESSLTQLYREFLIEALLTECDSSTCCHLIDNQKGRMIPNSAYRLGIKIRKNETCAKIKLSQSSIPWFEGKVLEVVDNKIRPVTSSLAISIRLAQRENCLPGKTYSTEYQQTTKAQRFEDSPSVDAAYLDGMTECLLMATEEIAEETSRDMHLILSLQPKSRY